MFGKTHQTKKLQNPYHSHPSSDFEISNVVCVIFPLLIFFLSSITDYSDIGTLLFTYYVIITKKIKRRDDNASTIYH